MACCRSLTLSVEGGPCTIDDIRQLCTAVNVPYSNQLAASNGVPPFAWTISAGVLPTGLSLDPGTGLISGTPTDFPGSSFPVTIKATDSIGVFCTKDVTFTVQSVGLDPRSFDPEPLSPIGMVWTPTLGPYGTFSYNFTDGATGTFSGVSSQTCDDLADVSGVQLEAYIWSGCGSWTFHIAVEVAGNIPASLVCPGPITECSKASFIIVENGVNVAVNSWGTPGCLAINEFPPTGGTYNGTIEWDVVMPAFGARHIEFFFGLGGGASCTSGTVTITPKYGP